jgi:hypothetical protein
MRWKGRGKNGMTTVLEYEKSLHVKEHRDERRKIIFVGVKDECAEGKF